MSTTTLAPSALDLYAAALSGEAPELWVRRRDGSGSPLPLQCWLGPLTAADEDVLARAAAPVLDVGCGPGRHVLALAQRGMLALGIDISSVAIAHARRRGAPVVEASVFDRIPSAGRWGSALLLDGNVGIGGCPHTLLCRLATLVAPGAAVLVELDPPGAPTGSEELRLEAGGRVSDWFTWARVGVDGVAALAAGTGLAVSDVWEASGRWFAALVAR
jgi:SAM-dependent methyltransferase